MAGRVRSRATLISSVPRAAIRIVDQNSREAGQSGRSLETLEAYSETVAVRAVPESTNIWSLVTATGTPSASATPARMFEFATRQAAVGTGATSIEREIVTCQVGVGWLWACWAIDGSR